MAAKSPIMRAVIAHAERGGLVLGICNGFQVLTETRLLPGALLRNAGLKFACKDVPLAIVNGNTAFTRAYREARETEIPIAHGDGRFVADEDTLDRLEGRWPRRVPLSRQPERFGARHRRHHQRPRQRHGHDASPRARIRSSARAHRRAAYFKA